MEISQDIVSCYPVNHLSLDLAWWRNSRSVGWRSDYEGHRCKQAKNSIFYSLVSFTRPREKPWKRKLSSNCFVSQHFFTWEWDQKSIDFHLQWEEESDFLHAVAIQAGQKFQSNLWRKQIIVIFNDCQDMLQNVDDIINQPFPVTLVFNRKLTNFEVGFILQPFFRLQSNWEA